MSPPAFTPGKWFAVDRGRKGEPMMSVMAERLAGRGPSHEVAMCATGDSPQAMESANARLIAAAPELYKAARLAEAALARGHWIDGSTDPEAVALFALRAALARAEGDAQ